MTTNGKARGRGEPIEWARAAVREALAAIDELERKADATDHRVGPVRASLIDAGRLLDGDEHNSDVASAGLWEMRWRAERAPAKASR